jgi:hypothetical protein
MWGGSGRRTRPHRRLDAQPANPHLRWLSMNGDTFHHEIRWNHPWRLRSTPHRLKWAAPACDLLYNLMLYNLMRNDDG